MEAKVSDAQDPPAEEGLVGEESEPATEAPDAAGSSSEDESPEEAAAAPPARSESSPVDQRTRTVVAIGDLHGDYFRLRRLLIENDILLPDTDAWNPEADRVDLILIGDYVDWRKETLEGPREEWVAGARRILELLFSLHNDVERLHASDPGFDSRVYALLGNHDDMMLEAHRVFKFLEYEQMESFLSSVGSQAHVKRAIHEMGLSPANVERLLKFLNWYVQGGEATIDGFEGLNHWKSAMDGDLGDFLRDHLRLGVVVNQRLYAHTAPDHREFWRPLEEIVDLPESAYRQAKEAFLWSRRVWGYDYYTGTRTAPFTDEELDEMLRGIGVTGLVVGHTPLTREGRPVVAYDGRVVNIDLHGFPDSAALVEEYVPAEPGNRAPRRIGDSQADDEAADSAET
ncbi:hypothetical protein DYH09_15140 [bacterium CPR1]|nr:hypothetical protein [bacterium CPR1]